MKLEISNLDIGYVQPIVENINITIQSGEIAVLLGKNGSGKSTLLKTIMQFIAPLKGNINFNGNNLHSVSTKALSRIISIVLSHRPTTNQITARSFILHGMYPYNPYAFLKKETSSPLFNETVQKLQLQSLIDEPIDHLSDGNFQKVNIARAILQNTPIILMDEPLSHLDLNNQFTLLTIIRNLAKLQNKIIIFSSHDWNQSLQIADQLWLIKDDKLISGNTEDIALQEDLINYLSHPQFQFDFCMNQFLPKDSSPEFSVNVIQVEGESEKIFWLYKALGKENIKVETQSPIHISFSKKGFLLNNKGQISDHHNLSDLILKIKEK